jgi:hypothetical protein
MDLLPMFDIVNSSLIVVLAFIIILLFIRITQQDESISELIAAFRTFNTIIDQLRADVARLNEATNQSAVSGGVDETDGSPAFDSVTLNTTEFVDAIVEIGASIDECNKAARPNKR